MKQSTLDLNLVVKQTRKQTFLSEMDRVIPWAALVELIAPYYPEGKNGRPPFALETMLRSADAVVSDILIFDHAGFLGVRTVADLSACGLISVRASNAPMMAV